MATPEIVPNRQKQVSPRTIVPLLTREEHALFASTAPVAHLSYHGGPLLSAVEVVTIFWGNVWQQPAQSTLVGRLNQFFDFILTSGLMDLLAEYSVPGRSIGHGSRIGTATITASEPGGGSGKVSDSQIQQALQGLIQNGTIAQPNPNTLYFVYLPPGVTSTLGGSSSCQQFCGYHNHINNQIFYAVEPFITCGGCTFGQSVFDSLTKVSSHELCEAITDPALDAWFDDNPPGNEIGDICNASVTQLGGFTIQTEWSNRANVCVSNPRGDHFYTTSLQERDHALANLGYNSEGEACFVSSTPSAGTIPLHRLLLPTTGQHFYTTSDIERDNAVANLGFQNEGEACFVSSTPSAGTIPLHRLFQSTTGEHFYTTSDAERDNAIAHLGYQNEGEACFVSPSDPSGETALYRLINTRTGFHFYTTSLQERDNAIAHNGFQSEGEACFVSPIRAAGTLPLHRLLHLQNGDHFYTTSDTERDHAVTQGGYQIEGEACFVSPIRTAGSSPLHRLFNSRTGEHFYTTSDIERDNAAANLGFQNEGEACFVNASDPLAALALYRVYKRM